MQHQNNVRYLLLLVVQVIAFFCKDITGLKHHLVLTKDHRYQVSVSSFGYNQGGRLEVIVQNLTLDPDPSEDSPDIPQYGFILVKSNQARNPYAARPNQQISKTSCLLNDPRNQFKFDLMVLGIQPEKKKVTIKCTGDTGEFPRLSNLSYDASQRGSSKHSSYKHEYTKRAVDNGFVPDRDNEKISISSMTSGQNGDIPEQRRGKYSHLFHKCRSNGHDDYLPLEEHIIEPMGRKSYSFNFTFYIDEPHEEGNYYMSFHNCRGYRPIQHINSGEITHNPYTTTRFNLSMLIFETNYPENFLSAGVIPLPQMYFILSIMFFLSGCVWMNFISRQKESILQIHKLMTVLVLAKAFSLLFHGINYHYIALDGQPVVTWAYLYYTTRAVKGVLFFITLALIGSGWTFVKHILSQRDKTMILAIVALQMIAHIAEILLDESTEGEASIEFWWQLCGLVDLLSCIFILLPITWSVRHLEAASRTDGKAAISLKRLELFKSFYIVSTAYIYVTRIMTYVFLSMLTYKYSWLSQLFLEFSTLVYFIVTGYYFQPMPTNPYLLLSSDADMEEDVLFSVDAHEMNGSSFMDNHHANKNTTVDLQDGSTEDGRTMKRRHVEELV